MVAANYLKGATFLLKMSIFYPIDEQESVLKLCLYYIWAFFYLGTFVTTMVQCLMFLYITPFNFIEETFIIMNIVFYASFFINALIFFSNSSKLVEFVKRVNSDFVYETDNQMEAISMQHYVEMTNKVPFYWTIAIILAVLAPTLTALATFEMKMPFPAWFPYDYKKSPMFEISYFWQLYCLVNLGIFYGVTDSVYPCIVALMGQQFKILGSNFRNGFYKALLIDGVSKKRVEEFRTNFERHDLWSLVENFADIFEKVSEDNFRKANMNYFNKNIKHHLRLLQFCNEMDPIMSMFLLVKCGGQMFNVVFIAFTLLTSKNPALLLGLWAYIVVASIMLWMYTYSGQIFTESTDILWTLYDSPWYLCEVNFQKSFLLVQTKASQTICTKAGYYFTLSAGTFIMFMRAAFSYIAVFKELISSEN